MAGRFAILTRPLGAWSGVPASHPRVLQDPADRDRRNQFGGDYFNDPLFNPGSLILNATITAVPELSTWIMMIVGFAGTSIVGSARAAKWRLLLGLGKRMRA